MPTALERQGDFSQTFDNQGRLLFIRDPLLAGQLQRHHRRAGVLPGQRHSGRAASNPTAQALLNLFPLPNADDPTGTNQYNYVFQTVQDWPRNDPGAARGLEHRAEHDDVRPPAVRLREARRRRLAPRLDRRLAADADKYEIDTVSYVNTLLHTFNPTLFGEFTVGVNWAHQYTSPFDEAARDANDRRVVLPGLPQFFPQANPLSASSAAGDVQRRPSGNHRVVRRRAAVRRSSATTRCSTSPGNITKIKGAHNMKAGLFVEHTTRPAQRSSSFNGT